MSYRTLVTLAEAHHCHGLIGIADYVERCRVAEWLRDESGRLADPRIPEDGEPEPGDDSRDNPEERRGEEGVTTRTGPPRGPDDPGYLQFLFQGWVFTKADPDPYPSTPHGHWLDQNRKWPKLNPYSGRVFRAKDNEDTTRRLRKSDMRLLWRDEAFKDFCRGHLLWYAENFRFHRFPVHDGRLLDFPRW